MKRFIAAAALAASAAVPATAGALPPGNSSVPVGSTAACFVVATPAAPAICNFIGAGSGDVGVGGFSTGGYTITHQRKVAVCDATTNTVSGYKLQTVTDDSQSGTNYIGSQDSYAKGVVFTLTVNGEGFAAVGGQGTPGADMASDPAVGPAPGYAGAEDGTGGAHAGDAC
jgi:hypothetical protein